MAKILAYQTPAMGHLFPFSALLTELRDRGHDIALRTLAAGVETGLGLGFATAAVDPRIEAIPLDDAGAPNPKVALKQASSAFARHAEYEVTDLAAAIDEVRPDVVIVDANCWGAAAVAEASGLPWAVVLGLPSIPAIARSATVGARAAAVAGPGRSAPGRAASTEVDRARQSDGGPAQPHSRAARRVA